LSDVKGSDFAAVFLQMSADVVSAG